MAIAKPIIDAHWLRIRRHALTAFLAGAALLCVALVINPDRFFQAYLTAYNFWLGIALGCLALLMLQHLTGGAWGILLRRILEAAAGTMPLLIVLFLPLIAGLPRLFIWARPDVVAEDTQLAHKSLYLNVPFFLARAAAYGAIWLGLSVLMNWLSAIQDQPRAKPHDISQRLRIVSAAGLILYGLTATFASIDWMMSLEPLWYSTIFPPLYAAGQLLSGIAFAILVLVLLLDRPPLAVAVDPIRLRDFGNLLLTFVIVWAYLSFSQFLIIWSENLPEETRWYLYRLRGGWQWVALALVLLEFAIPFLLLLSRDVKENPRRLMAVALLVLGMRFVDLLWWVEASFGGDMWLYCLFDVAALVGMGGLWIWWFLGSLARRPLVPVHDPYLPEFLPEFAAAEASHD